MWLLAVCVFLPESFIADRLTAIVKLPCRTKHLPVFHLWTGPGAVSWVQNSLRAERSTCVEVGRTVDITQTTQNRTGLYLNVFALKWCWYLNTGFTFCVTDSIASHALSTVQALPVCTLALVIILRGEQGIRCKETALGQVKWDGLIIRALTPNNLISISASGFLYPQGDLLADERTQDWINWPFFAVDMYLVTLCLSFLIWNM